MRPEIRSRGNNLQMFEFEIPSLAVLPQVRREVVKFCRQDVTHRPRISISSRRISAGIRVIVKIHNPQFEMSERRMRGLETAIENRLRGERNG